MRVRVRVRVRVRERVRVKVRDRVSQLAERVEMAGGAPPLAGRLGEGRG